MYQHAFVIGILPEPRGGDSLAGWGWEGKNREAKRAKEKGWIKKKFRKR